MMRTGNETVTEALTELTGRPLVFGDTSQIAAVRFIEKVDRCEESLRECTHELVCDDCDGSGEAECSQCGNETECEACGGSGVEITCTCTEGFSHSVISEARKRLARRKLEHTDRSAKII
jgi:DnaJ-class molecular chaperone